MHCFSVGVEIQGKEKDICTIVPGNEKLKRDLEASNKAGTKMRDVTDEEINRAIDYHLKHTHDQEPPQADKAPPDAPSASILGRESY